MFFKHVIAVIARFLTPHRALVLCRATLRRTLPCVLCLLALSAARMASATVAYSGDVIPSDDPFKLPVENEGVPKDGNDYFLFELVDKQTYFEGTHRDNNPAIQTDDTNVNYDIVVGQSAFGTLQITEVALRDQDLTIGDSGQRGNPPAGPVRTGTGVVRITGLGALYNNDPTIIPPGLPMGFKSVNPRAIDVGFDLWVGKAGNGTLEISVGGRAEIQDAVVVANGVGSTGSIIVDGFDSYLGSGGFEATGGGGNPNNPDPHWMTIGRLGVGYMTIRNGGTVQNEVKAADGNQPAVAAVLGGDPFLSGGAAPEQGGTGIVTVNGTASKWIVGGTLQIGGFNRGSEPTAGSPDDLEGDNTIYNSEAGRGTLYVQDGALVNVRNSLSTAATPPDQELFLAIGRFGRVVLSGNGLINIGGGTTTQPRSDNVRLINDGVIQGSGRIETGVFTNRYYGEVRVGPGERLIVDSSAEFASNSASVIPALANYGVMQVFGAADIKAELEFDRAPNAPNNPIQPFQNLRTARPTTAPISDFYGGLISGQHSIIRFRSGLINTGMMAFTAGNNYVTGNVANLIGPPAMPADGGIVKVSGPGTKLTFEEDFVSTGVVSVTGGATLEILARHSFVTAGDLQMTLDPTSSNKIVSFGDAGIAGKLSLTLDGFSAGSLQIGDSFEIISVTGSLGGVDLTDPNYPRPDLTTAPLFSLVSFPNLASLGLPATTVLRPIYLSHSVLVTVASAAGASGPDFNGDGIVNGLDLNVWLANVGITTGASVVQGDADGDGDVDGDDFLFWQRNVGRPMPWTGAGSGAGSGLDSAVPEPTSLALLLISAVFSLAYRPRRTAR